VTEGGKSPIWRQRKRETIKHEETVGQHDQREMAMKSIPTPALIVIEAAFLFGIFVKLLDDPARMGQQNQTL
jgi:hypothetical protein